MELLDRKLEQFDITQNSPRKILHGTLAYFFEKLHVIELYIYIFRNIFQRKKIKFKKKYIYLNKII